MASRQQIKQRIGSVKNTKQITRAMQLVAASKLRRAQDAAVGPTVYANLAREILTRLRQLAANDSEHALFTDRPIKNRLLIVVSSDLGLAGAYDANVIRRMIEEVKADRQKNINTLLITIGKKAAHAANRISGVEVEAHYQELADKPDADAIRPILTSLISMFIAHKVDAVDLIHTRFVSTIVQKVDTQRLLPAGFEEVELSDDMAIADIEPSAEVLVRIATERLIEAQVYQALLDAKASEHSMRMLAMKSATDNASDLIEDLTLVFNNARQAAITQELAEISGGVEAMK
jgi:F-type H+-transporting ATPase subunit gamma